MDIDAFGGTVGTNTQQGVPCSMLVVDILNHGADASSRAVELSFKEQVTETYLLVGSQAVDVQTNAKCACSGIGIDQRLLQLGVVGLMGRTVALVGTTLWCLS